MLDVDLTIHEDEQLAWWPTVFDDDVTSGDGDTWEVGTHLHQAQVHRSTAGRA